MTLYETHPAPAVLLAHLRAQHRRGIRDAGGRAGRAAAAALPRGDGRSPSGRWCRISARRRRTAALLGLGARRHPRRRRRQLRLPAALRRGRRLLPPALGRSGAGRCSTSPTRRSRVGVAVVLARVRCAAGAPRRRLRRHAERRRRRLPLGLVEAHAGRVRRSRGSARPCGLDGAAATIGRPRSPASRTRADERHLAEERHAQLARHGGAAAVPEELGARAAARAEVVAHVLDHAEHGRVHLVEHLDAAPDVGERDVLRRRDDDAAGDRRPAA